MNYLLFGLPRRADRTLRGWFAPSGEENFVSSQHVRAWLAAIALCWTGSLLVFAAPDSRAAEPTRPFDKIMPASTKVFVTVGNLAKSYDAWSRTELGRLYADPALKPFREDLNAQLKAKNLGLKERIGIALDDIKGVASGEVCFAIAANDQGQAAYVLLADVGAHLPKARQTLDKIGAALVKEGGVKQVKQIADTKLEIFQLPPTKEHAAVTTAYFMRQNVIGMADDIGVATDLIERLAGAGRASLSGVVTYQTIMQRAAKNNKVATDLAWYADPLGALKAIRAGRKQSIDETHDPVEVMESEGFDAVEAVGGVVSMSSGPYGFLFRTFVLAPQPFQRAMKMLAFPNGGPFSPAGWVPADVSSYVAYNWDMMQAFDSFGTLFDLLFGDGQEGVWGDVQESLKNDPNGPQIDLRNDLIAHLGKRAALLTDTELPIGPQSQRRLFAAEVLNAGALAKAIERSMENDPATKKREFEGHTIYEIVAEEQFAAEAGAAGAKETDKGIGGQLGPGAQQGRLLPNSAVTVANNTLLVASHLSLLEKVLTQAKKPAGLAAADAFHTVEGHLQKLGAGQDCMQAFYNNAERWVTVYELFRTGKLPESDMPLARIINSMFPDTPEGEIRKQQIDGSKLPDYKIIRKYFGLGGMYGRTEEDGWMIVGFTLTNAPAQAQAQVQVPQDVK
jgi:hypothetical protein